jgi:hypothetical protein
MDFLLDSLTDGGYCLWAQCKHRVAWDPERLTASYTQLIALGAGMTVPADADALSTPSPATAATSVPGTLDSGI